MAGVTIRITGDGTAVEITGISEATAASLARDVLDSQNLLVTVDRISKIEQLYSDFAAAGIGNLLEPQEAALHTGEVVIPIGVTNEITDEMLDKIKHTPAEIVPRISGGSVMIGPPIVDKARSGLERLHDEVRVARNRRADHEDADARPGNSGEGHRSPGKSSGQHEARIPRAEGKRGGRRLLAVPGRVPTCNNSYTRKVHPGKILSCRCGQPLYRKTVDPKTNGGVHYVADSLFMKALGAVDKGFDVKSLAKAAAALIVPPYQAHAMRAALHVQEQLVQLQALTGKPYGLLVREFHRRAERSARPHYETLQEMLDEAKRRQPIAEGQLQLEIRNGEFVVGGGEGNV